MKRKEIIYSMMCAIGGGIVGVFSSRLNEIYGCVLFIIGITLIVYSVIRLSK